MKQLFLFLGLMATVSANADYLYWQVSEDGDYGSPYDSARVIVMKKSSAESSDYTRVTSTTYLSYNTEVDNPSGYEWQQTPVTAYVDLGDLGEEASLYAFYIELGTYDSGAYNFVADSHGSDMKTYDQLSQSSAIVSALTPLSAVQVWSAGGSYAVPEPTSGILMMLGLALVGLRRRKV